MRNAKQDLARLDEIDCSVATIKNIYVASSWRNQIQQEVVKDLRAAGFEVYDFKNPAEGNNGFKWSDIDPDWQNWTPEQFRESLRHPIAARGFNLDMDALRWCDACVLVMPCGRSAHLEAGYAIGAGKPTAILLSDGEPELMYRMAPSICLSIEEVINFLRVTWRPTPPVKESLTVDPSTLAAHIPCPADILPDSVFSCDDITNCHGREGITACWRRLLGVER